VLRGLSFDYLGDILYSRPSQSIYVSGMPPDILLFYVHGICLCHTLHAIHYADSQYYCLVPLLLYQYNLNSIASVCMNDWTASNMILTYYYTSVD